MVGKGLTSGGYLKTTIRLPQKRSKFSPSPTGDASSAIGPLMPGFRIVGVSRGQFSMLDMIETILGQIGPAAVAVSTWTQGKSEIERVTFLLKTLKITDFRLLVDRSFVKLHPEYVRVIQRMAGPESLRQTRTHAKFALIAVDAWRIVIRTSMNLNRNPRLEQFDVDDDQEIYAFFETIVNEVFALVPAGISTTADEIEESFNKLTLRAGGADETTWGDFDFEWADNLFG